jgi:hypothetical protein
VGQDTSGRHHQGRRGNARVTVTGGDGQTQSTKVVHDFPHGMNGDPQPAGGNRSVIVVDSAGGSYTNHDE